MWKELRTDSDLLDFMEDVCYFHDSCLSELNYVSGAYVDKDLYMHPINDRRVVKMLIHRQCKHLPAIELEFEGIKFLKLYPLDELYTCEISDSSMFISKGYIYWCDRKYLLENDIENFEGTLICASKLRWRPAIRSTDGDM